MFVSTYRLAIVSLVKLVEGVILNKSTRQKNAILKHSVIDVPKFANILPSTWPVNLVRIVPISTSSSRKSGITILTNKVNDFEALVLNMTQGENVCKFSEGQGEETETTEGLEKVSVAEVHSTSTSSGYRRCAA